MNQVLFVELPAALALGAFAFGGELETFGLVSTRTQADHTLSKSYETKVMRDGSVRRSWHLKNRDVVMDFNAGSDRLICLVVDYKRPVAFDLASRDAMELTGATIRKWQKLAARKARQFGLKNAAACKLRNGSYIFLERVSGNRCTRLVIYAQKPAHNRFELEEFTGLRKTAMGTAGGSVDLSYLVNDEADRQARPADPRLAVRERSKMSEGAQVAAGAAATDQVDAFDGEDEDWIDAVGTEDQAADAAWYAQLDEWAAPVCKALHLDSLSPALRVAIVYASPLVILLLVLMLVGRIRRAASNRRIRQQGEELRRRGASRSPASTPRASQAADSAHAEAQRDDDTQA